MLNTVINQCDPDLDMFKWTTLLYVSKYVTFKEQATLVVNNHLTFKPENLSLLFHNVSSICLKTFSLMFTSRASHHIENVFARQMFTRRVEFTEFPFEKVFVVYFKCCTDLML